MKGKGRLVTCGCGCGEAGAPNAMVTVRRVMGRRRAGAQVAAYGESWQVLPGHKQDFLRELSLSEEVARLAQGALAPGAFCPPGWWNKVRTCFGLRRRFRVWMRVYTLRVVVLQRLKGIEEARRIARKEATLLVAPVRLRVWWMKREERRAARAQCAAGAAGITGGRSTPPGSAHDDMRGGDCDGDD